jgi:glycosyltransferase involved in cell wall biosynthesis
MIVIDDQSTDHTGAIIDAINKDYKFKVIHNTKNVGALANIYNGIKEICKNPEDIIITLDGDDSLFSCEVLSYLNKVYNENPNIWITHGQYIDLATKSIGCNRQLISTQEYRTSGLWCASHLRSFKLHLWNRIKEDDLKQPDGRFFQYAYDNAILYPMFECSGLHRVKYISEILYNYNNLNVLSEDKKNVLAQLQTAQYIRSKPCYQELP